MNGCLMHRYGWRRCWMPACEATSGDPAVLIQRQQFDRPLLQGELAAERQQHAALVASLQDVVAGLQSSGDAEQLLRQHLTELAERVAVLTAAQVRWLMVSWQGAPCMHDGNE